MAVPSQYPRTTNKLWRIYIKDVPFSSLYDYYERNFESKNRLIREYSVIWFRRIWSCLNNLAGSNLRYGKGVYIISNEYNPSNTQYGRIIYETKKIYNRNDGLFYNIMVILNFDLVMPYTDNYGGRRVYLIEEISKLNSEDILQEFLQPIFDLEQRWSKIN